MCTEKSLTSFFCILYFRLILKHHILLPVVKYCNGRGQQELGKNVGHAISWIHKWADVLSNRAFSLWIFVCLWQKVWMVKQHGHSDFLVTQQLLAAALTTQSMSVVVRSAEPIISLIVWFGSSAGSSVEQGHCIASRQPGQPVARSYFMDECKLCCSVSITVKVPWINWDLACRTTCNPDATPAEFLSSFTSVAAVPSLNAVPRRQWPRRCRQCPRYRCGYMVPSSNLSTQTLR